MPTTREEILAAAKAMTPAQRYDLIEDIRQILDEDDELSPEQMAEIHRRLEAVDSGDVELVSAEQAAASVREKLRRMRRRRAS